ncbi:aminoglycoside phosphotransferase family protein [Martelella sp. FOR1707]
MPKDHAHTEEVTLKGGRSVVSTLDNVVFRQSQPWSTTTIALLRHLERVGFQHAPRVVGVGIDERGREMLTFIEGESVHPYPWKDEALPLIGEMLRKLHEATTSFVPPDNTHWRPWFGRTIGRAGVIGHCDTGAWNIIARDKLPVALIDWEEAGPVDPLVELAQACWLNALLFDDDLGDALNLGSVEARARQVSLLLDGYGLPTSDRVGFIGLMRDFAIQSAANEASEAGVTPDTTDASALWGITWRARSAAWLVRHHDQLRDVVEAGA